MSCGKITLPRKRKSYELEDHHMVYRRVATFRSSPYDPVRRHRIPHAGGREPASPATVVVHDCYAG